MSRLVYSAGAYLRSVQISNCQIFGYVEGGIDRPFYERLIRRAAQGRGFRIISAKELPGNTGGKPRLIEWFKKLRRSRKLSSTAFGKSFINIFFFDKDIDEVSKKKLRSPHAMYTPTYDLEGHLVANGNLVQGIADAAGITVDQAQTVIQDKNLWVSGQVRNWQEWIALCMVSQVHAVNVGCTFDRPSDVNIDLVGTVDQEKLEKFKQKMRVKISEKGRDFDFDFLSMLKKIDFSIKRKQPLKYFKGKWFRGILQKIAHTLLAFPDAQINSLGERLIAVLIAQTGASQECAIAMAYDHELRQLMNRMSR